jgi:hypothetical protein
MTMTGLVVFDTPFKMVVRGEGTTLYVNTTGSGGAYKSVRYAVENASSKDTVLVYPGEYHEDTIDIKRPITVKGQTQEGVRIISRADSIFINETNNVTIENLNLIWDTPSYPPMGIRIMDSNDIHINHVKIENLLYAVFCQRSKYIEVHNLIAHNVSNGYYQWDTPHITLKNCELNVINIGLYITGFHYEDFDHDIDTSNIINGKSVRYLKDIRDQKLENLGYDRLYIFNATNVTIKDTNFINGDGLNVFYSEGISVENVIFQNNSNDGTIRHSKVTFESCNFYETSKSIHIYNFYHEPSVWIYNSTFENVRTAFDTNQVNFIMKNTQISNGYSGISNFDKGIIDNVIFENCTIGIHKGNPGYGFIYNSTFINCTTEIDYDTIIPSKFHQLFIINSTFNESRFIIDENVNITVGWFIDVYVNNQIGQPVNGFLLNITDKNEVPQTEVQVNSSFLKSIVVHEKRFNPDTTYNYNPHNISVSSGSSRVYVTPEPDILSNRVFTLILRDNDPPITTDDYDGRWHNIPIFVNLTAIDNITSVEDTFYIINEGVVKNVASYGMPEFTQEGIGKLEYWSRDLLQNEETHKFVNVKIDFTPPETSGSVSMDWYNEDILITLSAVDNLSEINETFYRINNGPIRNLNSSGQPQITTEGANNTLEFWSIDNCGNEEEHTIISNIKLDKTPPVARFTANRSIVIKDGAVQFDATASTDSPPGEIIDYSWDFNDDGIYETTGEIVQYTFSDLGRFNVALKVTDTAGNWNTKDLYIDVEPDSDGDGIPDSEDLDDDGDGIPDDEDDFPLDPTRGSDITFSLFILVFVVIISLVLTLLFLWQKRGKKETPDNDMVEKEPERPSQNEEKLPPPQALKPPPPPPPPT